MVAVAGIVAVAGPGAIYSFSLLSGPLSAAFGWLPSEVTWAFAIGNFFLAVGGLIGGWVSDMKGPRVVGIVGVALWSLGYALCALLPQTHSVVMLYLCYGVVAGLGCGITYMAVLNAVIRWFPERRGFGGGLVIMGFGLGSFVYNLIVKSWGPFASINAMAQAYTTGLSKAAAAHTEFVAGPFILPPDALGQFMSLFVASGIGFALIGGIAMFFVANPPVDEPAYAVQYQGPQTTLPEMLGDARFYILWAMLFINVFGGITIISNMVPLMRELTGATAGGAAGLYAILAIFNGLGRLFWGALSDRLGRRATFAMLFAGQALVFVILDSSGGDMTIVAASIAILLLCYGGGFGVMPAFNVDYFGIKNFGTNYGMHISAWGMAAVVGTAFISVLKDVTGSFAGMMQPIAVVLLVATFLPLILGESHITGSQKELSLES